MLPAGLFGGGTVGGGVYEICEAKNKQFLQSIGCDVKISKICVQNASKVSERTLRLYDCVSASHAVAVRATSLFERNVV